MTKTEQDEKITEWLSWGMHNGVCPELLVVAALALGAAQERYSQYPYSGPTKKEEPVILTGNRPEDNASKTARGLVQPGFLYGGYGISKSSVVMLDEWLDPDTREQSIQAAKLLHPLLATKKPRKNKNR